MVKSHGGAPILQMPSYRFKTRQKLKYIDALVTTLCLEKVCRAFHEARIVPAAPINRQIFQTSMFHVLKSQRPSHDRAHVSVLQMLTPTQQTSCPSAPKNKICACVAERFIHSSARRSTSFLRSKSRACCLSGHGETRPGTLLKHHLLLAS